MNQVLKSSKVLFFTFFSLLIILSPAIAQQKSNEEDVVYLVNGSIIHGKIIEYKSGEYVKIRTCSRNVWVFKEEEIDKIVKEEVIQKPDSTKQQSNEGFFNITGIGVLAGSRTSSYTAPFSFKTINGYHYKNGLFIGGGVGVESFSEIFVPVFADVRYRLLSSNFSPNLFANVGYSFSMKNFENLNAKGGLIGGLGFGVHIPLNMRTALNFSVAYRYQQLLYVENDYWDAYETERYETYNRLEIRVGFLFR